MNKLIEILGWYGMLAIISAYALVSFSFLTPESLSYQLLNGTGAIGIAIISFHKRTYQPAVLNCIWTVIAIAAIVKILL